MMNMLSVRQSSAAVFSRDKVLSEAAAVLVGAALLALFAQARFPVAWSPVPITGQTLGVLLIGAMLGPRLAVKAVLTYVLAGAAGLPVFAGLSGGLAWLLGPTGGYIIGFVPAAWLMGLASERAWFKSAFKTALALLGAHLIIYTLGYAQLRFYVPDPLLAGVIPFLIPDAFKAGLALVLIWAGNWFLRRQA